MKTIREEQRGNALLRLVERASDYAGIAVIDGKITSRSFGADAEEVWKQLYRQTVESRPEYFGFDGARARFLEFFGDGFEDSRYLNRERAYKLKAKERLDTRIPLETAVSSTDKSEDVLAVYRDTNLLSPYEMMRVTDALRHKHANDFVRAAAEFAIAPSEQTLQPVATALRPHGIAKWTAITYLPFLWRPSEHMFLKPMVTKDYASRVGHRFADDYSSEIRYSVYESLLNLASETDDQIADLGRKDRIDTQSFIWVVGDYRDYREGVYP